MDVKITATKNSTWSCKTWSNFCAHKTFLKSLKTLSCHNTKWSTIYFVFCGLFKSMKDAWFRFLNTYFTCMKGMLQKVTTKLILLCRHTKYRSEGKRCSKSVCLTFELYLPPWIFMWRNIHWTMRQFPSFICWYPRWR